jgi:triphosphoribosyl-dephospho-CoA synthase
LTNLSIGACATLACLFEATAPKVGNVHRGADFEDLGYVDFLASAAVLGPVMERAPARPLGETILAGVEATRGVAGTNTNLGMVLLLAPLAKAARASSLADGLGGVLAELTMDDARRAYAAIRLARPGGLGEVEEADVAREPTVGLVEAMRLAADRDLIARQYANGFAEVFDLLVPWLAEALGRGESLAAAIVENQLRLMSRFPDSLVVRKCGAAVGAEASDRAAHALSRGRPGDEAYERALADFDFWLRSDGHRRNPGTTADLIASALFVALRQGVIERPFRFYGKAVGDQPSALSNQLFSDR